MSLRRWTICGGLVALTGCGVPLGGLDKLPTTSTGSGDTASISGLGDGAFLPLIGQPAALSTGEQDQPPAGIQPSRRGLAGITGFGDVFQLALTAGTAIQLVVAGPGRSDVVLTFVLDDREQRVDSDPLSPDLSVESVVVASEIGRTLNVRVSNYGGSSVAGLVRYYAWLLPSSSGSVRGVSLPTGPAGRVAAPATLAFDLDEPDTRHEVIVIGPAGSDLVLQVTIGDISVQIDRDPQSPNRTIEGFIVAVDDPATVEVTVTDYNGAILAGDVRWAVVPLPSSDFRVAADRR